MFGFFRLPAGLLQRQPLTRRKTSPTQSPTPRPMQAQPSQPKPMQAQPSQAMQAQPSSAQQIREQLSQAQPKPAQPESFRREVSCPSYQHLNNS